LTLLVFHDLNRLNEPSENFQYTVGRKLPVDGPYPVQGMNMHTTCVIGDIHGSFQSFSALLPQVLPRADTLVLLGDYIDRGPDSKNVVEKILQLKKEHPRVITLLGNHEFMFLNYLDGLDDGTFLRVGGMQTLKSYGLEPDRPPEVIKKSLPRKHLDFFRSLPLFWENPHGIYVHAGLRPGLHLSRQTSDWCLWIRDEFIRSSYNFGKPVIFGHTVFDVPLVRKNKIGIDTGAVYGKSLTGLLLPKKIFISVPGEQKHPCPIHL
jgi:serine/threonine protein phosphatase 1